MATAAQLLDGEAFNQLVLEKDLRTWEQDGYIYAGFRGVNGWELYRTYGPKWRMLYQARRVNTQNNAGGGTLHTTITVPTGFVAELVKLYVVGAASAGATLGVTILDEDNVIVAYPAYIAAGVSRTASLPSIGTSATSNANTTNSQRMLIGPGQTIKIISSAAAQTETLDVGIVLLLPINATATTVTWNTTGSAGTPSLAASTISEANTLQAVLMP